MLFSCKKPWESTEARTGPLRLTHQNSVARRRATKLVNAPSGLRVIPGRGCIRTSGAALVLHHFPENLVRMMTKPFQTLRRMIVEVRLSHTGSGSEVTEEQPREVGEDLLAVAVNHGVS